MLQSPQTATVPSVSDNYCRSAAMSRIERAFEELGVSMRFSSQMPDDWLGAYRHRDRCILIRPGMEMAAFRTVVAHELGHAFYGHECGPDPITHWRQEAMADAYAARLLVDEADYSRLSLAGLAASAMASALTVLPWVIEVYTGAFGTVWDGSI